MRFIRLQNLAYVLAGLLAWTIVVCAQGNKSQTKPNLTGTWMLDQDRSNVEKRPSGAAFNYEIKVTHSDPKLRFESTTINGYTEEIELTYYTDGRGEVNPTISWFSADPYPKAPKPADTKSRTRWSGDKIVTHSMERFTVGSRIIRYEKIEDWKLSADRKTLTRTTRFVFQYDPHDRSIYTSANRPDEKRLYNRVSKQD